MKQRFSSLDTHVIASELSLSLLNLRLQNIYDLSTRIFLLKFARPGKREQLLVDSGFRCHLTSFTRTASTFPSAFVQRFRKYLKSRRVTGVQQVGSDRVIEISFSEGQYRLYLEFFAAGNVVLCDAEFNVLALLRQVSEGDEDVDVKLGGKYKIETKQNYNGIPEVSEERVRTALEVAGQRAREAVEVGGKKAKRAKGVDDLRRALSAGFPEYPAHLLEHAFVQTGVDASWKIRDVLESPEQMGKVLEALNHASQTYKSLEDGDRKGYIIAKEKEGQTERSAESAVPPRETLLYDDYHPFRPSQFENRQATYILEFDGFNKTVDEFYSSIESQKLESKLNEREQAAERKLQTAKNEHAKRLGALQQVQEIHIRKAQAIEANTHRVEEACSAVNGLIGQGMDWVDIGKLIENEQGRGNAVAQLVKLPLKLEENTVTLLLDEGSFEEEDEDEGYGSDRTDEAQDSGNESTTTKNAHPSADGRLAIDIDLGISPWQNARQYYDQKKVAAGKEHKTMQASERALKSAEKKIQDDLKKGLKQEKAVLRPSRRQFWFEKFLWFISSDGYLVLGGKDAQQNEHLYRRYLKKGDIYVHADLQGAASVVVKNSPATPDAPIPPSTLSQAGALTVCTSTAWDSKAVMAAWWINADQVSKTAETGEYLQTGGFVVRGKKNFLPPSQLLLGFGVAWLISEESRVNHGKHRVDRKVVGGDAEAMSLVKETKELAIDDKHGTNGKTDDVFPDVEDVAEEADKEVQEDAEAVKENNYQDEPDDEDDDDDDNDDDQEGGNDREEDDHDGDAHVTDKEDQRTNPLQSSASIPKLDDQDESHEDDESDSDQEHPIDTPTGTDTPTSSAPSTQPPATSSTTKPAPQMKRGKRTKQKRALQKYADQSDDDRVLAMSLLGANRTAEKKAVAAEDMEAKRVKAEADRERRRKQHQRAAEAERVRQEKIANGEANTDDDAHLDEEDLEVQQQELHDHQNIDLLVPAPEPGDELVAAIPIVAPWSAMSRYKYKVKLQPGSAKKGKAVKEILGMWTGLAAKGRKVVDEENKDKERVWAREVELIKGWRVEEVVGGMPVKGCRVVQGGGLASAGSGGGGGAGKGKGGGQKGKAGSKKGR